jgi:hypothetical protein
MYIYIVLVIFNVTHIAYIVVINSGVIYKYIALMMYVLKNTSININMNISTNFQSNSSSGVDNERAVTIITTTAITATPAASSALLAARP